jgi:hypothetical protein
VDALFGSTGVAWAHHSVLSFGTCSSELRVVPHARVSLTVAYLVATRPSGGVEFAPAGVLKTIKKTSVQYTVIFNDFPARTYCE